MYFPLVILTQNKLSKKKVGTSGKVLIAPNHNGLWESRLPSEISVRKIMLTAKISTLLKTVYLD